ncbi:Carboxypeptidase SOL1 [Citrus sinensis]|nr:Carboxypeptidase SOL1 [Citrus sinensis]
MTSLIQKDKRGMYIEYQCAVLETPMKRCTIVGSTRHLFEGNPSETSFDKAKSYMTNAELEKAVKEFGRRCSNISRIYSIGKSVSGFPLWVIEISDKPGVEEPEPAFKFIGNVHGDEPVGRELLILLANWICDNHVKDSLARLIVENMHLHILPSMNPDGYALKRRGNANNIDLNRDFPDQGALVANYPWDGTQDKRRYYYGCPDDEAFQFLASVYSRSHYNMSLSTEFQGGIINGASWYPIYGGMQDWNYIYGGCFELTLEISDDKWPSAEELPTIWEYNKMSMLNLVASLVKVNAGRAFADYYRLLTPGKRYEVMASMPGYKPKSTSIWLEETATADFILDPDSALEDNTPRSICDCSCDSKAKLVLLEFLLGFHVEVCFVLIVIGALLCFLLKRRQKFTLGKHKQSPKRSVVV